MTRGAGRRRRRRDPPPILSIGGRKIRKTSSEMGERKGKRMRDDAADGEREEEERGKGKKEAEAAPS